MAETRRQSEQRRARQANGPAPPLPHDDEAERGSLSLIFDHPSLLKHAELTPDDFFSEGYRAVYNAMLALVEQGTDPTVIHVVDALEKSQQMSLVGGAAYVSAIHDPLFQRRDFGGYVKLLQEKRRYRRLIDEARLLAERAFAQSQDPAELALGATERLAAIDGSATKGKCVLQPFDSIQPEHRRDMWPKFLPQNKLVHLAGNSSQAKSPITRDLAARISSGANWPDGSLNAMGPRSVILLAAEDDEADTVRPALEVAGADLKKIFTVRMIARAGHNEVDRMLAFDRDLEQLRRSALSIADLAAIFIDPISNYLGSVQMKSEEDVRSQILMPLARFAAVRNILIVTVGHLNRREKGTTPLHRIMGTAAFHGVARCIYFVGPDPEDKDKFAHALVQERGLGAPSLRYRSVAHPWTFEGQTSEVVTVEWRGHSSATSEDLVDPIDPREMSAVSQAAIALREMLRAGRLPVKQAQEGLAENGFDVEALNWGRVMKAAGAKSQKFTEEKTYSVFLPSR